MSVLPYIILFSIIVFAGIILGVFRYKKARSRIISPGIRVLKEYGTQIVIDLDACVIKHREFYEDDEYGNKILKNISLVIFKDAKGEDKELEYKSPPIYLPENDLRKLLNTQKKTVLFIDPANKKDYYFDFEFLIQFMLEPHRL